MLTESDLARLWENPPKLTTCQWNSRPGTEGPAESWPVKKIMFWSKTRLFHKVHTVPNAAYVLRKGPR